jgi:hypothetical protein
MNAIEPIVSAVTAPNQFVETNGRRLALSLDRSRQVVLCTRFRGNMDVWDPAFLDALARNGFRVIRHMAVSATQFRFRKTDA